ncbi:MAG: zinc-finger domain-containing protein [Rhodocyclaceae bacterium]|nr:zinc-finger domain-containing protein [Rhodocyclaceae bacterium]
MADTQDTAKTITVNAKDLPLHCPQPGAPLWARHPRVYLDVLTEGVVTCPYCSARYEFTGERPKGHH